MTHNSLHWYSKLLHPSSEAPAGFKSLVPPVHRASTVLFERQSDVADDWNTERKYTYGLYGTPTVLNLGARIAELEDARFSFVVPGGQSALALVYLAYCCAGSHVLLPWNAYGPHKDLARDMMSRFDVEVEEYDPLIGSGISALIRENSSLVWCESPGSVTMEVQDVPAIVKAARERGVPVALDNTYSAGVLFNAFGAGVDISIQALTKYVGGHSDLLLGTVSVRDEEGYNRVGPIHRQLGLGVSPDACSLALRGLETLGIRLRYMSASALEIAQRLAERPEIDTVLHPALPSCLGHEFWKRDFTGAASVFSILFSENYSPTQVESFVDGLKLLGIGTSWGGTASLALVYPDLQRPNIDYGGRLVRLSIGLEETTDLMRDIESAMSNMSEASPQRESR